MQLDKKALGFACGILWGATVCLATVWVLIRGGGGHLSILNQFYVFYSISFFGAIVGLIWGFIDGFIGGWLLAWLYNRFVASESA